MKIPFSSFGGHLPSVTHRKRETLTKVMHDGLLNLQFEIELFERLLLPYPRRLEVLRAGDGDHTGF